MYYYIVIFVVVTIVTIVIVINHVLMFYIAGASYGGSYSTNKNYMGKFTDRGPRGKGFSNFTDPYRVGMSNRVSV